MIRFWIFYGRLERLAHRARALRLRIVRPGLSYLPGPALRGRAPYETIEIRGERWVRVVDVKRYLRIGRP